MVGLSFFFFSFRHHFTTSVITSLINFGKQNDTSFFPCNHHADQITLNSQHLCCKPLLAHHFCLILNCGTQLCFPRGCLWHHWPPALHEQLLLWRFSFSTLSAKISLCTNTVSFSSLRWSWLMIIAILLVSSKCAVWQMQEGAEIVLC